MSPRRAARRSSAAPKAGADRGGPFGKKVFDANLERLKEKNWTLGRSLFFSQEKEKKKKRERLCFALLPAWGGLFSPSTVDCERAHSLAPALSLSLSFHRAAMVATIRTRKRRREPRRPRGAASSCGVVALVDATITCVCLLASVAAASRFDSEVGTIGYGANGVVREEKRVLSGGT